jgi:uncharacterized protein YggE
MGSSKTFVVAVLAALTLTASAASAQPGQDKKASPPAPAARQVTVATYGADKAAPALVNLAREERARAPEARKDRDRKGSALGLVARPDGSLARRD